MSPVCLAATMAADACERRYGSITRLDALVRTDDSRRKNQGNEVDLGYYLIQIASAVVNAYAVDGIRLDLKSITLLC
jgi:hypothetical protein